MNWRALTAHERPSAKSRHASRESFSAPRQAIRKSSSSTPTTLPPTTSRGPITGYAASERLELNDAERVGPARKYEHVRRCHQTGELSAFAQAEERHIRESPSQICLLRPLADHDFRARQIKREESSDIFLNCDAACGEKDRTRQVDRDHTVRREQVRIDAARPHAQVLEAALA